MMPPCFNWDACQFLGLDYRMTFMFGTVTILLCWCFINGIRNYLKEEPTRKDALSKPNERKVNEE